MWLWRPSVRIRLSTPCTKGLRSNAFRPRALCLILGCSQAVRQRTLTPSSRWFDPTHPSQRCSVANKTHPMFGVRFVFLNKFTNEARARNTYALRLLSLSDGGRTQLSGRLRPKPSRKKQRIPNISRFIFLPYGHTTNVGVTCASMKLSVKRSLLL